MIKIRYSKYLLYFIERLKLRPGLLALLYGRIHRSVKKLCRDLPDRAARAPHAVHPPPLGHRLLEHGNTLIFVSKIAPNIYVSKYTFSALTCIIT